MFDAVSSIFVANFSLSSLKGLPIDSNRTPVAVRSSGSTYLLAARFLPLLVAAQDVRHGRVRVLLGGLLTLRDLLQREAGALTTLVAQAHDEVKRRAVLAEGQLASGFAVGDVAAALPGGRFEVASGV